VNPNKYLVDYLVHSYLYYIKGTSLITDYHKYLVIKESLDAGTSAYYIKDYPSIVKSVTEGLLNGSIKL
jgi:hypothetical protein